MLIVALWLPWKGFRAAAAYNEFEQLLFWIIGQYGDRKHLSIKVSPSPSAYRDIPARLVRAVLRVSEPFLASAPRRWVRARPPEWVLEALHHSTSRLMVKYEIVLSLWNWGYTWNSFLRFSKKIVSLEMLFLAACGWNVASLRQGALVGTGLWGEKRANPG